MVKTRSGSSSKNLQFLLYLISGFDVMSRPEVFFWGGRKGGLSEGIRVIGGIGVIRAIGIIGVIGGGRRNRGYG